jgi:hypothetical protein
MLRHVVIFSWTEDTGPERRAETLAALRRLPDEVGGMTTFAVGPDAEAFGRYAAHRGHLEVIAERVKPFLAARSAAQYEV